MAGNKFKGYVLGAVAAASYGLNPTFALPLYADGMNADAVLLLRYGFAIPIVAAMILLRGRSFRVPGESIIPLLFLGVLMTLSSLTLFLSYNHMAAGIASTILFVYPILVAVIMTLFFKEKLTMQTILCILLATSGILLMYRRSDGSTLSLTGTLLAIASAMSYAGYLVWVNTRKLSGIPTLTVTFYVLCVGTAIYAARVLLDGTGVFAADGGLHVAMPSTWYLWLDAIALAAIPTTVSLICTTAAIQNIGSTPTAILGAIEPVTAIVMGFLLFGETLTGRELFGIAMILISVSFVIAGGFKEDAKEGAQGSALGSAQGGVALSHVLTRIRHMFPKLRRR